MTTPRTKKMLLVAAATLVAPSACMEKSTVTGFYLPGDGSGFGLPDATAAEPTIVPADAAAAPPLNLESDAESDAGSDGESDGAADSGTD